MASSFQAALKRSKRKRPAQFAPSLPPLGSYDPSVLLQYGANKRTAQDAEDQFALGQAQAQDDFAIQTGRLDKHGAESLADIVKNRTRLNEDYGTRVADLNQNYGALAGKQAEGALKANVQSAGLLAQALAARKAAAAHDRAGLDTSLSRALADSTTAEQRTTTDIGERKSDLALNLARLFGSGTHGQPLGQNTLNLIQTKNNATAGNLDLSGVAYQQAAANGYRIPKRKTRRHPMVI